MASKWLEFTTEKYKVIKNVLVYTDKVQSRAFVQSISGKGVWSYGNYMSAGLKLF